MNHRSVRLMLFTVVLVAVGAAGYSLVAMETSGRARLEAERAFSATVTALSTRIADLRGTQQAYVAAGQGDTFWAAKVTSLLEAAKQDLEQLKQTVIASGARSALDAASEQIGVFEQMDARAREYVRRRQQLMASDLIFADGLEITRVLSGHVETARVEEQAEQTRATQEGFRQEAAVLSGVTLLGLAVLLLLATTGNSQSSRAESEMARPEPIAPPRVEPVEVRSTPVVSDRTTTEITSTAAPAIADGATAQSLRAAADLCTDLGRVANASELPSLLERAARLLDAAGIILWMADAPGERLRPVVSHGYSAQALARMKPMAPDAKNAAASAYRLAKLETVRTTGTVNGAIVAPLISPAGCVGVMATEVRNGSECKASLQAMASIIAAQLAALVTSTPQAPAAEAQTSSVASSAS